MATRTTPGLGTPGAGSSEAGTHDDPPFGDRIFADRADAGRQLAARLGVYRDEGPIVVGLAPGGVPVGYEVAVALGAALEVWMVDGVGPPGRPDDLGAVEESGRIWLDFARAAALGTSFEALVDLGRSRMDDLARRARDVRHHPRLPLRNRTVIVVDDGLAAVPTVRAAIGAIRQEKPRRVILALPAASPDELALVRPLADAVVCVATGDTASLGDARDPAPLYADSRPIADARVAELVDRRRLDLVAH